MRETTTGGPSSSFKMKLDDLLYAYDQAQGLTRLIVMAQLRHYVQTIDLLTVMDEIKTITEPKHLDVLIGVGMRGALYYAVVSQKAKLMGIG